MVGFVTQTLCTKASLLPQAETGYLLNVIICKLLFVISSYQLLIETKGAEWRGLCTKASLLPQAETGFDQELIQNKGFQPF